MTKKKVPGDQKLKQQTGGEKNVVQKES